MNTAFALMACYKSALIPLETVGTDYLGLASAKSTSKPPATAYPSPPSA